MGQKVPQDFPRGGSWWVSYAPVCHWPVVKPVGFGATVIRGCSQIMSAKNGGVQTRLPPFISHFQHFLNPPPPFVSPVSICLTPPPPHRCKNVPTCQQCRCKKNPILAKNLCEILSCFVEKVSNVAILRFLVAFFGEFWNFMLLFVIFKNYLSLLGLSRCFVSS